MIPRWRGFWCIGCVWRGPGSSAPAIWGLELWKRLELDRFFERVVDGEAADVPWSRVVALLAINRLCGPGSELAIEQRWYPSTALDDLLAIEEGKINDTRLYRCLDRILPHKTKLEPHLKQRYGELFGSEFDLLLYDLTTSTKTVCVCRSIIVGNKSSTIRLFETQPHLR